MYLQYIKPTSYILLKKVVWKKITGQSVGHCILAYYVFCGASTPQEVEVLVAHTKNKLLSYVE